MVPYRFISNCICKNLEIFSDGPDRRQHEVVRYSVVMLLKAVDVPDFYPSEERIIVMMSRPLLIPLGMEFGGMEIPIGELQIS